MICYCLNTVKKKCFEELHFLERDLPSFNPPFKKILHKDLAEQFAISGEIPWEEERELSEESESPFWITDYPSGSRGFYYLECGGILKSMDLIMPEGYGEVISGGEREHVIKPRKDLKDEVIKTS